jgi:predicted unusual protein kinase regulating ubiquinone biosynthesis (AarF/ABC1/UbiB family)
VFASISESPIAAASLGQVYKAVLRDTGEEVAVKVQRPGVLETVTVDLFIIRSLGLFMRRFPAITDVSQPSQPAKPASPSQPAHVVPLLVLVCCDDFAATPG